MMRASRALQDLSNDTKNVDIGAVIEKIRAKIEKEVFAGVKVRVNRG